MGDINDVPTQLTGEPLRDPPTGLTRGFCGEHTEVIRSLSETHALVKSQETLLRDMDTKLDDQGESLASIRAQMAYHSKFWGALAGTLAAAFWWLVGHFTSK